MIKKLMLPSQSRGLLKAQLQVSSQDWLPNLRSQCKMKCRDPCSKSRKEVLLREVKYYVFLLLQSLSLFLSLSLVPQCFYLLHNVVVPGVWRESDLSGGCLQLVCTCCH